MTSGKLAMRENPRMVSFITLSSRGNLIKSGFKATNADDTALTILDTLALLIP